MNARSGFTLVEMLVASLLMGMLVTILTMVFNSSSIAWRNGKAAITDLDDTRHALALMHYASEDALPHADGPGSTTFARTVGAWDVKTMQVRRRAVTQQQPQGATHIPQMSRPFEADVTISANANAAGAKAYTVGVTSAGPDGKFETDEDNITSWPEKKQ